MSVVYILFLVFWGIVMFGFGQEWQKRHFIKDDDDQFNLMQRQANELMADMSAMRVKWQASAKEALRQKRLAEYWRASVMNGHFNAKLVSEKELALLDADGKEGGDIS